MGSCRSAAATQCPQRGSGGMGVVGSHTGCEGGKHPGKGWESRSIPSPGPPWLLPSAGERGRPRHRSHTEYGELR